MSDEKVRYTRNKINKSFDERILTSKDSRAMLWRKEAMEMVTMEPRVALCLVRDLLKHPVDVANNHVEAGEVHTRGK